MAASQGSAGPEAMRQAMADYVRAVHASYVNTARLYPPAVRGRMPLLSAERVTVVAAGVSNLHVIGTSEQLPAPRGKEIATQDQTDGMEWVLRFYDPVVLPVLGRVDESRGAAGDDVRRALGLTTYFYHLIVRPGSQLTPHHAGHAGAGLANSHAAEARDFQAIRQYAPGRERLVDEMEGAATAGLPIAQAALAARIAPGDEQLADLADVAATPPDPARTRRLLLQSLRGAADADG